MPDMEHSALFYSEYNSNFMPFIILTPIHLQMSLHSSAAKRLFPGFVSLQCLVINHYSSNDMSDTS